MSFGETGQTRVRAWSGAVIWTLAGIGFGVTFFMDGGPGTLHEDSQRHLAGAGALAFGFVGSWLSLWITRRRRGAPPLSDERDAQILARANQATLVILLVGIFAFSIALWTAYESRGTVPVGWMWFLAYGSVILASVASPVATLLLDGKLGGHG